MKLYPETTMFLCLCTCIAVYLLLKFLNNRSSFTNRKNLLLGRHRELRAQSLKLQEALSWYMLSSHAEKEIFIDSLTYNDYSRYLQKNHIKNLSDKKYVKFKKSNNLLLLKSLATKLDEQEAKLRQAENNLSTILNNDDVINYNSPIFN